MYQKSSTPNIITSILLERFKVPQDKLHPDYWEEPLTGSFFSFSSTDLVYLFFELEQAFGVRYREENLNAYGWSTIHQIVVTTQSLLNEKRLDATD